MSKASPEIDRDWTEDKNGNKYASPLYLRIVRDVENRIRSHCVGVDPSVTAHDIVHALTQEHGLSPIRASEKAHRAPVGRPKRSASKIQKRIVDPPEDTFEEPPQLVQTDAPEPVASHTQVITPPESAEQTPTV